MVNFKVIDINYLDQTITIVTAHDIVECSNEPMKCAHFIISAFMRDLFGSSDEDINRRMNIAKYEKSLMTDFHGLLS